MTALDLGRLRNLLSAYQPREMMSCLRFAPPRPGGSANDASWLDQWRDRTPRQGAVMVLLLQRERQVRILLTERQPDLRHHAGEISLPGGGVEEGESPKAAALRETAEEVGLPTEAIELWGQLDGLYIPPSNYMLAPFTGLVLEPLLIWPNPIEVRSIIELPLETLFDPSIVESAEIGGRMVDLYRWQQHAIWGATARILNNLAEALGQPCEPWHSVIRGRPPAN